jgi:hypothetical protein
MHNTIPDVITNTLPFSLALSHGHEKTKMQTLYWQQPKRLKEEYYLRSQDQVLGSLYSQNNYFLRRAVAKTSEQKWVFKYLRLSLPKVIVHHKNKQVAQAIIETNWGWSGTVIFEDQYQVTWKPTHHTDGEFCFLLPENHPVVFFRTRPGFFKIEAEVEIDPAVLHNLHLPLLVMLGWFFVLLRRN